MKVLRSALVGLAMSLTATTGFAGEPGVNVIDPWVQEAPPAAKVMAAYMTLENTGDQALVLTGASSDLFGRIEIHATEMSGDMARMVHKDSVDIPPHAQFAFAPGGYHFMLMEPQQALHAGDRVTLTLRFRGDKQAAVSAEVRKAMEHGAMDHSSHTAEGHSMDHSSPMQHNH